MQEVSLVRLYMLRATYLLIALGMGTLIWPLLLGGGSAEVPHMTGVVRAMLGALSLIALVGVRHPIAMLPLLFWELAWKLIWVLAIGLPLWRGDRFTAATQATWGETLVGVALMLLVIPWGYVFRHYVAAPAERWRRAPRNVSAVTDPAAG